MHALCPDSHCRLKRNCLALWLVHGHNRNICLGMTHETKNFSESEMLEKGLPNFFFIVFRMSETQRMEVERI